MKYKPSGLVSKAGCIPYNPELIRRSRELRNNLTKAEKKIWKDYLRYHRLIFHRQKILDHYIVDFYCSKALLVIEIDGEIHYTDEAKVHDENRTGVLEGYGLKILRFDNKEVLHNLESVISVIEKYLDYKNM
ncbi:MAG: endonuclease domain-containing protein [Bacteroidetes bacterium]|nr:endonuclease domain-containing protein [Bacteroidota bacterium]